MENSKKEFLLKGAIQPNRGKRNFSLMKEIGAYLYLIPAFIFFILFVFYPFLKTIYLSLYITDPKGLPKIFIGFGNYINIFGSMAFLNSIWITFKFALIVVPFSIIIGLILAIMANVKLKGINIFRIMYSLPMAISSASASVIWMLLFHPSVGIINYLLHSNVGWLTDPKWALFAVAIVTIWLQLGINFIFLLAGLQGIPQDLYESADIDGAGVLRKHIVITIPLLSPTIFFLIVINIISAFQAFAPINIMTLGGPGDSTSVLVFKIYRDAFFNYRFGIASAESIVLFIILLILTVLQFRVGERKVFYK